jgi:hypothetical protein
MLTMLKSIISLAVLIALSIVVILFMSDTQTMLGWILSAHTWISDTLTQVFSGGTAGDLTRQLLALITIPIALALVPTIIYWLFKRSMFPYFMQVIWITWLIQTTALVIQFK